MRSCDLYLLSEKLQGLNYHEAVLCSGLNNQLNTAPYGGSDLYILQGRGIHLIDELLERLKIKFKFLGVEELFGLKSVQWDRVIVTLPYIDFEKIKDLKENVVQFFHTYGTYRIKEMKRDKLVLEGDYDERVEEKTIYKEDFLHLNCLKIKPINIPYKVIYICENQVPEKEKQKCLIRNIKMLLGKNEYFDELGGWVQGKDFYSSLEKILIEYWETKFNRVSKFVVLQSMQNGSSFFYRREFSESLMSVYGISSPELIRAGNLWRKLSRALKAAVVEEHKLNNTEISKIICEIESTERLAFEYILQKEEELRYANASER